MKIKALIVATMCALGMAGPAAASSVVQPSFSYHMRGTTGVFDGTASKVSFGFPGYTWTYQSANHLGVTMGRTATLTYKFPATGTYTVTLKVAGKCSPSGGTCWDTLTKFVTVTENGESFG